MASDFQCIDFSSVNEDCLYVDNLKAWVCKTKPESDIPKFLFSHININSISAHFDDYLVTLQDIIGIADVMAISETKLTPKKLEDIDFAIEGYNVFHKCRDVGFGGGITCYIKRC